MPHRYATAPAPSARALLLAATLALVGASAARAQVVYTDIADVTISSSSADSTFEIDLDEDGAPDLRFQRQTGVVRDEDTGVTADVLGFGARPINDGGGVTGEVKEEAFLGAPFEFPFAAALPPNEVVGPGSQVDSSGLCLRVSAVIIFRITEVYGEEAWREGGAFLGFSFSPPGSEDVHYGWARFQANEGCTSATLEAYAYQATPGEPILAGNTGAGGLPVELVAFEARADADRVVLEWATASETGNAGFEVQQEIGGAFQRVGFVEGAGTTAEGRRYAHAVGGLPPGTHRFRLKQLDLDGAFAFSPEVEVRLDVPGTHVLTAAYPNPFNPRARFTLTVAQRQRVEVAVYDALGRRVTRLFDGVLEAGAPHPFEVDGHAWPSGVYLIRATGEAFAVAQRVTLVK